MPVRGVDHNHVYLLRGKLGRPFEEVARRANRRPDAQSPLRILGRVWILQLLLDILDRDQALQDVIVIDDQQFLDAILV